MAASSKNMFVRLACGIYRGLLYAYPSAFRLRYGGEMEQAFGDQLRDTITTRGVGGLFAFCIRTAWDLARSVMRERFTLQSVVGILCVAAALGFSIYAAHVDHHNKTEVYPTLAVVLVGSFIAALIRPRHAWRWAIFVALGVPFFGPLPDLLARLAAPGRWAMLAVLLVPGLLGAYAGAMLRRAVAMLGAGMGTDGKP
jgi:hypothetical protein